MTCYVHLTTPLPHLITAPQEEEEEEEAFQGSLQRPPLTSHLPFLELQGGGFAFKDTPDEQLLLLDGGAAGVHETPNTHPTQGHPSDETSEGINTLLIGGHIKGQPLPPTHALSPSPSTSCCSQ